MTPTAKTGLPDPRLDPLLFLLDPVDATRRWVRACLHLAARVIGPRLTHLVVVCSSTFSDLFTRSLLCLCCKASSAAVAIALNFFCVVPTVFGQAVPGAAYFSEY